MQCVEVFDGHIKSIDSLPQDGTLIAFTGAASGRNYIGLCVDNQVLWHCRDTNTPRLCDRAWIQECCEWRLAKEGESIYFAA